MVDNDFINSILKKGIEAKEKAKHEFSNTSLEQLNWKPSAESWSIAQCLEHLIIADSSYFSDLKKITEGTYKMSFWEKFSPFTAACGRIMKSQLQEQVKRKMITPQKIRPSVSELEPDIIDRYYKNLDEFLDYISKCLNIDIDKTILTSPTLQIVTYSLRDAFYFLIRHEHRHLNQAIRVKNNKAFPN